MTQRERILSVYRGEQPDVVPYMLDLSHWFYQKHRLPWDLSASYDEPEYPLIDYHKSVGAGFYVPNLGSFYSVRYPKDVAVETEKRDRNGAPEIVWRLTTPLGTIERARLWHEQTYSWAISQWGVRNEKDLQVLAYALEGRTYAPLPDRYQAWVDYVGEDGVVYLLPGYSAMGHLLQYWMGVEGTMYATVDFPDALLDAVTRINNNNLLLIDLLCESPGEVVVMGDNISSDVQSPRFLERWSCPYYEEAIRRLHAAGKFVAIHIDGKLSGAIETFRDLGADCADAVTPTPMGDLSPAECRAAAGKDFILSGGVSPDLWLPNVPIETFKAKVIEWLDQKHDTFRFIANAGDQVPPGAEEQRILIMRDLVEEHGRP